MERDFFFFYGVDINDCSLRRMMSLFRGLPINALTNYEISEVPAEARLWDTNIFMQANILDALAAIQWTIAAANSKRPPKKPTPVKRPSFEKPKPRDKKSKWVGKTIYAPGKVQTKES